MNKWWRTIWQLPTQSDVIYENAFSLETSDIITDNKNLFFQTIKINFFQLISNLAVF